MIDWNKEIQAYGAGDNSVTDRMWYELALEICQDVQTMCEHDEGDHCEDYIAEHIKENNNGKGDFKADGKRIYERMLSLRASFTSRITIEYVRQQLEMLLKFKDIS